MRWWEGCWRCYEFPELAPTLLRQLLTLYEELWGAHLILHVRMGVDGNADDFGVGPGPGRAVRERLRPYTLGELDPPDARMRYVVALCGGSCQGWLREALSDDPAERKSLWARGQLGSRASRSRGRSSSSWIAMRRNSMRCPDVIPPGGGEVVGDAPDRRVEILCDDDALHVTWSRFAAGRQGADLHVHRHHTDLFYVLDGELTIRLGLAGDEVAVPAGTLARVPPLVVHGFRNASDADVRYLNLHAPGQGFAAYMRALRDGRDLRYDQHEPPPDGGRSTADAVFADDGPEVDEPGMRAVLLANVDDITVAHVEIDGSASPPHTPSRMTCFHVLEGELTIAAGGRELRAARGAWAQLPPGTEHRLSAAGPARFLAVHAGGARS